MNKLRTVAAEYGLAQIEVGWQSLAELTVILHDSTTYLYAEPIRMCRVICIIYVFPAKPCHLAVDRQFTAFHIILSV